MFLCVKSFSLQDSEELSSEEEEMKIAEMRPPLIEITINQPKVVALTKDKKGTTQTSGSLQDSPPLEVVHGSTWLVLNSS